MKNSSLSFVRECWQCLLDRLALAVPPLRPSAAAALLTDVFVAGAVQLLCGGGHAHRIPSTVFIYVANDDHVRFVAFVSERPGVIESTETNEPASSIR
jgi:hypothetical protein